MKHSPPTVVASVLLLGLSAGPAGAEPGDHVHLEVVDGLDFTTLLGAALQQAPRSLETPVRQQQAQDYQAAGKSLLAGRPSLFYNLFDDRYRNERVGFRQLDLGLQMPLWRPGERRDFQAMAEHYGDQVDQWSLYLTWELAGRLRGALIDLQAADAMLALEQEAEAIARQVHEVTQRLVDAGSLAQLDAMQSRTLVLEQQQRVFDAEAVMVDAERNFNVLTGLDSRPGTPLREMPSPEDEIPEAHPLLRYLQSEVVLAADGVRQSELDARGSPTLTLGTHSDRAAYSTPTYDSFMVTLNIPIGGKRLVQSRTSGARREQVDAEVTLRQARIDLQALLHEAEHGLFINSQTLPLAEERVAIAERRRAMAQGAFEAGELTLAQVLTAVQDAIAARQTLSDLQLERERLASEYNQLIGVLP